MSKHQQDTSDNVKGDLELNDTVGDNDNDDNALEQKKVTMAAILDGSFDNPGYDHHKENGADGTNVRL
jgi:hypothetical protein